MIYSDWHIHSEYSHDAVSPLETIAKGAMEQGLRFVGITDHVNLNDEMFLGNLKKSANGVHEAQKNQFTGFCRPS